MALRVTDAHLAVIAAGTAHTFTVISIGTGHRTPDGTETALVTPFNPVREKSNPPGAVDETTRVVDWIDGSTGDNVAYTASEAGLWATPAGGSEYLALYDSHDVNDLFTKSAGNIISHRFLMLVSYAQLANAAFTVDAVPQATETVAGVLQIATDSESAAEALGDVAVPPKGLAAWWAALTIAASKIPNLPASRITSGLLSVSRIPNLAASKITSGVLALSRIPDLPANRTTNGQFSASRISRPSETEAEAGTSNSLFMTPLRTSQVLTDRGVATFHASDNAPTDADWEDGDWWGEW